MLVTVELNDHVYIRPHRLEAEAMKFVSDEITRKYANKVIPNIGLVICMIDLVEMDDLMIHPTDGGATVKVRFTLMVFKPVVGEILTGRILRATPDGVDVTLGFYEDIHIPTCYLQPPSLFDTEEEVWFWSFDNHKLYMDLEQKIRFRVGAVHFAHPRLDVPTQMEMKAVHPEWDQPATATLIRTLTADTQDYLGGVNDETEGKEVKRDRSPHSKAAVRLLRAPMGIIGTINEDGLGLLGWWE